MPQNLTTYGETALRGALCDVAAANEIVTAVNADSPTPLSNQAVNAMTIAFCSRGVAEEVKTVVDLGASPGTTLSAGAVRTIIDCCGSMRGGQELVTAINT